LSLAVLFFEVRGTRCALPVSVVREVLAAPHVTPVPRAPAPLRGLVPVHGQVLPLLDVGPALMLGNSDGGAGVLGSSSLRPYGDQIVVVESELPAHGDDGEASAEDDPLAQGALSFAVGRRPPVRAALVASRVTRLGTIEDGHSWRPPPGPGFVRATVLDGDGPALLLDAGLALDQLRHFLAQAVQA
jgi:chemotaxis signal transduction protein